MKSSVKLRVVVVIAVGAVAATPVVAPAQRSDRGSNAAYGVAFASFAPLDTDIFVAAADGGNAQPFLAHPDLDYNASFSTDGEWVVFTSERQGSADVYRAHLDGTGLARLTDSPTFDDQGALSPDGRTLAFVSMRSGQADVWLLELSTGALRNLTNHPRGDFRPAWSPNGQWIAFSSDRDSRFPRVGFTVRQTTDVYVVRPDGSGLRRVTVSMNDGLAGSPSWSPDGKKLLVCVAELADLTNILSARRLGGTTQVVAVDLASDDRKVLTGGAGEKWSPQWISADRIAYASGGSSGGVEFVPGPAGARGEVRSPAWSADRRRMIFHRDVGREWPPLRPWQSRDAQFPIMRTGVFPSYAPQGDRLVVNDQTAGILHNSIVVMDSDGSHRSVLFGDRDHSALAPVWSPHGESIAFSIGRFFQAQLGTAIADIAVIRSDGTGLRRLTDGSGNYGFPSWSPDGREIVFRAAGKERNGLFIVAVETGKIRTLTGGQANDNFPTWSPDGKRIAFTSNRDGDYEIYTIAPDGTGLARLTTEPGNDAHSRWSPDGQWIAFTTARRGFKDESILHPYNPQPQGDIYVMRADGSDVRMLTDNQFEDGTPSWITPRAPVRR